jgi:hypothetical protein
VRDAIIGKCLTGRARFASWRRGLFLTSLVCALGMAPLPQRPLADTAFWCPMHPEIRGSSSSETCSRCGMTLVPVTPAAYGRYDLDVDLRPPVVRAGRDVKVRFRARARDSGQIVRDYAVVHERRFHLFVVGHDLNYFAHVHPDWHQDGTLDVTLRLPKPGVYRLLADFVPSDAPPQWIEKTIVTSDYEGTLASAAAALHADLSPKLIDGVRVTLGVSPTPVAGREQPLVFDLADAVTGAPISDLELYLGASGHLLTVSEDVTDAAHSHPIVDAASLRGPKVVFQVVFPRKGLYRVWAQFQRAGRIVTVHFTIPVTADDAA